MLRLDQDGEPVRVQLTSLPGGADLSLDLQLSRLGTPVTIDPPEVS